MLRLEGLVGSLSGRAVVVNRLGGRHIGTAGPLEAEWERVQLVLVSVSGRRETDREKMYEYYCCGSPTKKGKKKVDPR